VGHCFWCDVGRIFLFHRNRSPPRNVIVAQMRRSGDSGPGPGRASLVIPGRCFPEIKGESVARNEINRVRPLGLHNAALRPGAHLHSRDLRFAYVPGLVIHPPQPAHPRQYQTPRFNEGLQRS
jgi:hypothetical protein